MTFNNPIVAGGGSLALTSVHSPGYQAGVSGWSIKKDGTAEFNALTVRGRIVVQSNAEGIFLYGGIPALGNLLASIASAAGVDPYGNNFKAGIVNYKSATSRVQIWNGVLLFHDDSYLIDATINNHKGTTVSDPPSLQLGGPSGNNPSPAWSEIDLNGISDDGTNGPSIDMTGFLNGGVATPIPVRVNGNLSVTGVRNIQYKQKTADQTLASQTTPQPDNTLSVPLVASATYHVEIVGHCAGPANGIQTNWSAPAGTSGCKMCTGPTSIVADGQNRADTKMRIQGSTTLSALILYSVDLTATTVLHERGLITTGVTAGNLTWQWAQITSSATVATMFQGSYMVVERVG